MSDTYAILKLRKLADTSAGARAARVDRDGNVLEYEPWPLLGIAFEGEPPALTSISTTKVAEARKEGWITGDNEQLVTAPGGPPDDPYRVVHTFVQYDALTFHTVDGDVRYRVTKNPGKYGTGTEAEVRWFYTLERED